jgi:hypothetical protein
LFLRASAEIAGQFQRIADISYQPADCAMPAAAVSTFGAGS